MKDAISLESLILTVRGQKVLLDADLAAIYGVPTKALNQAVKRNTARFPEDFLFRLSNGEASGVVFSRSQTVTLKRGQNIKYLPYAFTEHGALMASNVLNSPEAVKMSVHVVRAFIKQRELLAGQVEILKQLAQMDAKFLKHDEALRVIWQELQPLLAPPQAPLREKIGFHIREDAPVFGGKFKKRAAKPRRNRRNKANAMTDAARRPIRPESLPPAEVVKKVERRLTSEEKKSLKRPDVLRKGRTSATPVP